MLEWIPVAVVAVVSIVTSLRVLREYERGVVFRLGRLTHAKGPGLIFLLPFGIERMVKVPLRIVAMDIPPQDVITRDNVSIKVNAVLYFRVQDPVRAIIVIQDYLFATSQFAQTTLRTVVGQAELDQLLGEREHFNQIIREHLDQGTDPWGIDVTGVEIKDIDLPSEMQRAMAKQAEAERERRAKVISAQGELQASAALSQAAEVLSRHPAALQLRYLQTATEIAAENNSTTLFPIPLDIFRPFIDRLTGAGAGAASAQGPAASAAAGSAAPDAPAATAAVPPSQEASATLPSSPELAYLPGAPLPDRVGAAPAGGLDAYSATAARPQAAGAGKGGTELDPSGV